MSAFAPAQRIPPPGCVVRTVVAGAQEVRQPIEQPKEPDMPRGVYERKPKPTATPAVKRKRGGGQDQLHDLLADMRRKRAALDAAIKALEAL